MRQALLTYLAVLLAVTSCTSPTLDNIVFECQSNRDCSEGTVCTPMDDTKGCLPISELPIRIGMSAPLQGSTEHLGVEIRRGVSALFERTNQMEGGIFGRELILSALNDDGDPKLAVENSLELLHLRGAKQPGLQSGPPAFALLGYVGTPGVLETAPIAAENQVPYFAPVSGAHEFLRDGTQTPYTFNFRAGFNEEAEALITYLAERRRPRVISTPAEDSFKRIIAVTQADSYGEAGYQSLIDAYNQRSELPVTGEPGDSEAIARLTYEDPEKSLDNAIEDATKLLESLLDESEESESVAFVLVDTYAPGNKFVRAIKDWVNLDESRASRLDLVFAHFSCVGPNALAEALTSAPESYLDVISGKRETYASDVLVTQVVPHFDGKAPGLTQYREDIAAYDEGSPTFVSLEGYIAASLFVEALKLSGPEPSAELLRQALESGMQQVDLGLGISLGFSPENHQASQNVWISLMQADGSFSFDFRWDPSGGLQLN